MDKEIGEVFIFQNHKLMVVEHNGCEGCFFEKNYCLHLSKVIGDCERFSRLDHKNIIFKCVE